MIEVKELLNGILLGLLGGLLLFYGVRTEVPYPSWVVMLYDEPLVRIGIFLTVFVLLQYDVAIGVLATLLVVFLHADMMLASSVRNCVRKKCDSSFKVNLKNDSKKENEDVTVETFASREAVTGNGSAFGRTAQAVVDVSEGTVLRSPFYPLTDMDSWKDPLPGEPAPFE